MTGHSSGPASRRRPAQDRRRSAHGQGGRKRNGNQRNRPDGRLPRNAPPLQLQISHIGGRGDGVGRASYTHHYRTADHNVFVPATLPGEDVLAQPLSLTAQGIRCVPQEILTPSPERRDPDCDAFPACGGCTFQHWQDEPVTRWKRTQLDSFLQRENISPAHHLDPHISPRNSRRRATFHLKRLASGVAAGFLERGSSHIITPAGCSVLRPELAALLPALAECAGRHFPLGITIDAAANCLDNGICLLLRGPEGWHDGLLESLATWADGKGLARLSVAEDTGHAAPQNLSGTAALTIYAPAPPRLAIGGIDIAPPPGAFLQATSEAESVMQADIARFAADTGLAPSARILDLYAGCGTLGLPLLASGAQVLAAESDADALAALKAGVDAAGYGAQLTIRQTDLANAPLTGETLPPADLAIIDPPRSGAAAQIAALVDAPAAPQRIAMVSCNPASFARDAAALVAGGYVFDRLRMIDQFRFAPHVELVAGFVRQD